MIPDNEIINAQLIKASAELTATTVCRAFGISRSVFYYRRKRYAQYRILKSLSKRPKYIRATPQETVTKIRELSTTHGWKAARISRELTKQGNRLSERTVRKYIPKQIEPKSRKKYPQRQYSRLEQLQLDVKGRIYIGKQKLHPIGIIDRGTRVALTELRPSFKAETIITLCERFIRSYGKPKSIKTDNHRCFRSRKFNTWMDKNGIRHHYIAKKSSWQNGYIESYFKTLQTEFLKENYFTTINEASTKMREFVKDYNAKRYHSVIRCTPNEKFNNTEDNTTINLSKMSLP
ncbi:integrase core domain-containing protein [[Eubacterium] cellulosolvens]